MALGRTGLETWALGSGSSGGGSIVVSTGTGIVGSALQVCLRAGGPEHFLKGETGSLLPSGTREKAFAPPALSLNVF